MDEKVDGRIVFVFDVPVFISEGTFIVSRNKLHLSWGGGDAHTQIITIHNDTLNGTNNGISTTGGIFKSSFEELKHNPFNRD